MTTNELTEVSYETRGAVGWLTLDRPEKRNSLTPAMIQQLHRVVDAAEKDPDLRSLVITGAGPTFCAGADLGFMLAALDGEGLPHFRERLLLPLVDLLRRLRGLRVPIIAAVNGPCVAGVWR